MRRDDEAGVTITIPRALLPTAPPVTVTLRNCLPLFGLTPVEFRRLASKRAFPVTRSKGVVVAMYDDVRNYFAASVQLEAPRVRKAGATDATSTEKILAANGLRIRR